MLTRREFLPERMDDPNADAAEMEASFRFIRLVNRHLGGIGGLLPEIRRLASSRESRRPLRWLDLGSGAADIPLAIDRWATQRGIPIECVALENHPRAIEIAAAAIERHPRVQLVEGDAREAVRRFGVASFDLVHAGMFLHHLPDLEILAMLRIMEQVAGRIVWNDLRRSRLNRRLVSLLTLPLHPAVRHDATISVAKGFTAAEMRDLAGRVGLRGVGVRRAFAGRLVLTAKGTAAVQASSSR
jgi:hypothetical protein